jgi:hypothetical protein
MCAMIRVEETGLALKSAPEFSGDGRWPPVTTEWTPLRWGLFESSQFKPTTFAAYGLVRLHDYAFYRHEEAKNLMVTADFLQDDPLREDLFSVSWALIDDKRHGNYEAYLENFGVAYGMEIEGVFAAHRRDHTTESFLIARTWSTNGGRVPRPRELRRVVHSVRWRRQDPVIQLPPGATHEATHSITTGLTIERSMQLARSLGIGLSGKSVGIESQLSAQINKSFGINLAMTAQREDTRTLTLVNQSKNRYRRFALWNLEHQFTVAALDLTGCERLRDFTISMPRRSGGKEHSWVSSAKSWALFAKILASERTFYPVESSVRPGHSGLLRPVWTPREEAMFATADAAHVTYIDIDRSASHQLPNGYAP